MEMIHPINLETCKPHIGKTVCAVMHDGQRVFGYLKGIENEQLILTDQPITAETSAKRRRTKKAKTQALTPFPAFGFFPGGRLALDLALIALLFAVPFIW